MILSITFCFSKHKILFSRYPPKDSMTAKNKNDEIGNVQQNFKKTRIHSRRMRTVRNSSRLLGGGGACSRGCLHWGGGACSQGGAWGGPAPGVPAPGGCLLWGGACSEVLWGDACSQGVGGGGCLLRGCLLQGRVPALGLPAPGGWRVPGGGGIPACTEADSPPCGQTDRCKNITFATLLRTVTCAMPQNQLQKPHSSNK